LSVLTAVRFCDEFLEVHGGAVGRSQPESLTRLGESQFLQGVAFRLAPGFSRVWVVAGQPEPLQQFFRLRPPGSRYHG